MVLAHSIRELTELTEQFKNEIPLARNEDTDYLWYRGQSSNFFQLLPSLFRVRLDTENNPDAYVDFEKQAFLTFKELPEFSDLNSWDIAYAMQHYGVKTRFLDWSVKGHVGLFFAFSGWNPYKGNAAIWLLKPNAMNWAFHMQHEIFFAKTEEEYSYEKFLDAPARGTFAISPDAKEINEGRTIANKRLARQMGTFTLHDSPIDLVSEIEIRCSNSFYKGRPQYTPNQILKKIELSPDMYDELEKHLEDRGHTFKSIYPDVEGVALHVNRTGFNKKWFEL